jgi:hypothetical protein
MRSQSRENAGAAGVDRGTQDSSEAPWKSECQFPPSSRGSTSRRSDIRKGTLIQWRFGEALTCGRVQKINHQGTKITKQPEGMPGKRRATSQATKPTLPDHFLPYSSLMRLVPWRLVFLAAPAGR